MNCLFYLAARGDNLADVVILLWHRDMIFSFIIIEESLAFLIVPKPTSSTLHCQAGDNISGLCSSMVHISPFGCC